MGAVVSDEVEEIDEHANIKSGPHAESNDASWYSACGTTASKPYDTSLLIDTLRFNAPDTPLFGGPGKR